VGPGEDSVAQRTAESKRAGHLPAASRGAAGLVVRNKQERRKIHRHVYRGCRGSTSTRSRRGAELLEVDPGQAERFFGNRDEHRDETHDPGFEPPADGTLRQHEAFDFDYAFKGKQVDHIAVASTANVLVLEIDGTYYTFDAQLAGALRRSRAGGAVNLNL
jgi:hypothetical protein